MPFDFIALFRPRSQEVGRAQELRTQVAAFERGVPRTQVAVIDVVAPPGQAADDAKRSLERIGATYGGQTDLPHEALGDRRVQFGYDRTIRATVQTVGESAAGRGGFVIRHATDVRPEELVRFAQNVTASFPSPHPVVLHRIGDDAGLVATRYESEAVPRLRGRPGEAGSLVKITAPMRRAASARPRSGLLSRFAPPAE